MKKVKKNIGYFTNKCLIDPNKKEIDLLSSLEILEKNVDPEKIKKAFLSQSNNNFSLILNGECTSSDNLDNSTIIKSLIESLKEKDSIFKSEEEDYNTLSVYFSKEENKEKIQFNLEILEEFSEKIIGIMDVIVIDKECFFIKDNEIVKNEDEEIKKFINMLGGE